MKRAPDLSVVLFTDRTFATLGPTLRALAAQTAANRIEVILVAPGGDTLEVDAAGLAAFHSWKRVACPGPPVHGGRARAAGARAATAPVVAFGEDHSFPEPEWAAALIARHGEDWVAVAPEIVCGNPEPPGSWAMLAMTFGPFVAPVTAGEVTALPWHNTCYKRKALLDQGDELDALLEAEGILLERLRDQGGRFFLEPAARTRHVNLSKLSSFPVDCYWGARLYAAVRCRSWPWRRRLLYAAASPLIWLKRTRSSLEQVVRIGAGTEVFPRFLPVILACEAVAAAGEARSYLGGMGVAADRKGALEMHRYRYLASTDPALAFFDLDASESGAAPVPRGASPLPSRTE